MVKIEIRIPLEAAIVLSRLSGVEQLWADLKQFSSCLTAFLARVHW